MHLTRLALTDFRSYPELSLELGPGVTTFSGPNGEGKTNLVEAIGYVATLGSHRVATDAPLVRRGADRAVLRAAVTGARGSTLIEIELNPGRANRVRLNRAPMPRPRDVLGALRTVLFAPEDLALVKGDPGERRRFLDELLTATAPRYAGVRSDYERVLKQRTALLKSAGPKGGLGRAKGVRQSREAVTATLDVATLPTWSRKRTLLIGDAAHATSPHAGQGASLALEDAMRLARLFQSGHELGATFEKFESERRPRAERVVALARRNGNNKREFSATGAWIRDRMLKLLIPLTARGMDWMYANCSTTAQRGALDWFAKFRDAAKPVFEKLYQSVESGDKLQPAGSTAGLS